MSGAGKIPIVAIAGRTNVGKSTLFNALLGFRKAIVEDEAGVTRDRHYALVTRHGAPFTLVDTGGLIGDDDQTMQEIVREQSEVAIAEADLILAVFDGAYGVHEDDKVVVDVLRRSEKPVFWIVNKCEKPAVAEEASEFYQLGIDEVRTISAAHYTGVDLLVNDIVAWVTERGTVEAPVRDTDPKLTIAIIGKPNVGKSTLINKLLGEERLLTSDQAGTTRDSIDVEIKRDGKRYIICDTAGLRKKARIDDGTIERYSNLRTLKSLVKSDVAVLVLDATLGSPSEQDAKLAGLIHERGKSFIIAVNKWDAVEKDHRSVKAYENAIREVFKFAPYAPIIFFSALTGRRVLSLLDAARDVVETSTVRVPTAQLNKVIRGAFERRPPPVYRGEPIKFSFATQVGTTPPTIVLMVNHPRRINFSYERYIKNQIREEFPFEGSDIRIIWRKKNAEQEGDRA
jgi:GTP-binding protein